MQNFDPFYGDATPYGSQMNGLYDVLPVIMSIIAVVLIIALIIGIVCYVFMAIGLYSMAKNRKLDHAWLAWIPIAQSYVIGSLINDDVSIGSLHIPYAKIFLPLSTFGIALLIGILGIIPGVGVFLGVIISLAFAFYQCTALFWLFSIYSKTHRVLFLVLSILFTFLGPIFIFIIRKKEAVDERHPEAVLDEVNYDSKSIIALSLGIFSIISCFTFIGGSVVAGGVGLIFGIIATKEQKSLGRPSGMALAGLICSIVGLSITILFFFACIACIGLGASSMLGGFLGGLYR